MPTEYPLYVDQITQNVIALLNISKNLNWDQSDLSVKTKKSALHWVTVNRRVMIILYNNNTLRNLVPRACDPREGTRGSGIIRCRKPGIVSKIELRIPFQRPIRFLPETDYPRASRSFPRIAGSGNEIALCADQCTLNIPVF